jgi:hypothetical protein
LPRVPRWASLGKACGANCLPIGRLGGFAMNARYLTFAAGAIGRKARQLLDSLPEEHRSFNVKAVSPEHWWMV